jgi:hypothetical protein
VYTIFTTLRIDQVILVHHHYEVSYLLTRRIIRGLRILYLDLLDITSGGIYNHL